MSIKRAQNSPVPIHRLLKSEMIYLFTHKCKHGHNYAEHYACFLAENPLDSPFHENLGVFDIETTGLKSNWSHMFCWSMKEQGKDIIHSDLVTRNEARNKNDKRIIRSAVEEIKKYDRVITWYGSRFDIPYLRSRAIYHQIEFPSYRALLHTDLYYVARSKLAIHSNRLASVCQFFGIKAKSHPMTPELWVRAGAGEKEALETVLKHCKEDTISTDACWVMLSKYSAAVKRSI